MSRKFIVSSLILIPASLLVLWASDPNAGGDWPMWGGTADRNMVSSMKSVPTTWDVKTKKNIRWVAELGSQSYGNPVVAGGMVYVGTNNESPRDPAVKGDKGVLMAFRESDGEFQWQDANRIHVRTVAAPGQAISIQVTHHPGWHAKVNGISRDVKSDGLGLMWIAPGCTGPCDVQLEYTAGAELLICHVLSAAALVLLAVFFCWSVQNNFAQRA